MKHTWVHTAKLVVDNLDAMDPLLALRNLALLRPLQQNVLFGSIDFDLGFVAFVTAPTCHFVKLIWPLATQSCRLRDNLPS